MAAVNSTSEDFSVGQWKANAITQIVSAIISFIASLLIVASTGKALCPQKDSNIDASRGRDKKKTSPYRRIIFCISFSDILYSLAFITGPFMVRSSTPQALWAVSDSNAACVVNGIFFFIGAITSLLYYAALCYFYYCKISKRMTDEQFTQRYEKKIHITIVLLCVLSACLSLAAKSNNTYPTGTFCANTNTPAGCNQQPEIYGECDPKVKPFIPFFTYYRVLITVFSIAVVLYSMIRLIHSVLNKDRIYGELPSNPSQEQMSKYELRKQLLRETTSQAIMYTVSWFICQSATIAVAVLLLKGVSYHKLPPALQICFQIFIPLNSAVNVFIYTRPAVRHVRRVDPNIYWFRAFWMVLKAGGEAPNMEQSSNSTPQQSHQQQQQPLRSDKSSRQPFGYYYTGCDPGYGLDTLNVELIGNLEDISEELGERMNVSALSALETTNANISSNSKIHGLESEPLGKDVNDNYYYYEPRKKKLEEESVDILSGGISQDNEMMNMNVSTTVSGQDGE